MGAPISLLILMRYTIISYEVHDYNQAAIQRQTNSDFSNLTVSRPKTDQRSFTAKPRRRNIEINFFEMLPISNKVGNYSLIWKEF